MSETQARYGPKPKHGHCKHIVLDVDEAEWFYHCLLLARDCMGDNPFRKAICKLARLLRDTEPEPIF